MKLDIFMFFGMKKHDSEVEVNFGLIFDSNTKTYISIVKRLCKLIDKNCQGKALSVSLSKKLFTLKSHF